MVGAGPPPPVLTSFQRMLRISPSPRGPPKYPEEPKETVGVRRGRQMEQRNDNPGKGRATDGSEKPALRSTSIGCRFIGLYMSMVE